MLMNLAGVLFDGVAYGSLLFLMSVGLSVTMGLMNFVNLAHGAFATLEGCVFMAVAMATFVWGPTQRSVQLPEWLTGQLQFAGLSVGVYRVFLILVVCVITLALWLLIERTRFGAKIRASVDNQVAAKGLGINVHQVFSLTFALGSGLGGLGGALGVDVLGLDPSFPLKYMVYFLIVVAVGGAGTIRGPLVAALVLGVFDVAGKYYAPNIGAFMIYGLMVVLLLLFPRGLLVRRS